MSEERKNTLEKEVVESEWEQGEGKTGLNQEELRGWEKKDRGLERRERREG